MRTGVPALQAGGVLWRYPRACASRFTLGYNMTGLQPLGGACSAPSHTAAQTCKPIGNNYSPRMAKKSAAKSPEEGLFCLLPCQPLSQGGTR